MTKPLTFGRDINSYNAYAPMPSENKFFALLTAGAETNITIPTSAKTWIVAFAIQPGTTIWVDMTGATASVPVTGTLTPTTAELNPGQRMLPGGTKISVITSNVSANIGIMLWPTTNA